MRLLKLLIAKLKVSKALSQKVFVEESFSADHHSFLF